MTSLQIHVWYCHHHQAYWAAMRSYTERGGQETDMEHHYHSDMEWGPFDSHREVGEWLDRLMSAAVTDLFATIGDAGGAGTVPPSRTK